MGQDPVTAIRLSMDQQERQRLDKVREEDSALLAEHSALWTAQVRACEALYRARNMGIFATPELIAEREEKLEAARHRLAEWQKANNWYQKMDESPESARRALELASRIASGA